MKTLFQVTCINKQGLRALIGPAQGRHMHATRGEGDAFLAEFIENNSTERLADIYGEQALGTFQVDAFECYDHGDPVSIYVEETACARMTGIIRVLVSAGHSLEDAARKAMTSQPALALEVMDIIGSWPSSERELAALQRVWR